MPSSTPSLRTTLACALVALVTCMSIGVGATASSAAPGPIPVLTRVTHKAAPGGAIDVSWTSTADADHWKVIVVADGVGIGNRTFPGTARTGRVFHVPPGTSVSVAVGAIDRNGVYEAWLTSTGTITTARDSRCPKVAGGTCALIDGRATSTTPSGVGLGVLHGVTDRTSTAQLDRLDIRHWRLSAGDEARIRLARRAGGEITLLLSDPWITNMGLGDGRVFSPWADFDFYRWWVGATVQWHIDRGLVPDRWEVQNEPLASAFDLAHPPTQDAIVEMHAVATEAIRALLPDAKIVGPSFFPFENGHGLVDMEAFAQKAAARGLQLDGVAWHEILGVCGGCDGGPSAVRQHVDDTRAALTAVGLGSTPIDITEYGAPYEQLQPGAIVGYLSALSDLGVRFGGMACWDRPNGLATGCFTPEGTLDGLLLPDGTTPTDAWWAYEAYAQLSNQGRLARTVVDDPSTSAISSASTTTVRALIGRHKGCTAADGPCPLGTTPGLTETVNVRTVFPSTGKWKVVVSRLASTSGASAGPVAVMTKTITATTSPVSLGSWAVADGELLQVVATRV